eukprot:746722-Hanusia_phi.AAC.2
MVDDLKVQLFSEKEQVTTSLSDCNSYLQGCSVDGHDVDQLRARYTCWTRAFQEAENVFRVCDECVVMRFRLFGRRVTERRWSNRLPSWSRTWSSFFPALSLSLILCEQTVAYNELELSKGDLRMKKEAWEQQKKIFEQEIARLQRLLTLKQVSPLMSERADE